jgi:sugar-specific transcriptional regulator TrmB
MTTISELEERLNPLRKMGLTQYQVKVYAGLVSLGYTTAYQISYVTKVPYPKVYNALAYLKEMGLVEESRGRPKRFRAKPPLEAITSLQDVFVRDLKTSLKDTISELKTVSSTIDLTEERGVWNIVGRRNVLSQMKGLLRASKERAWLAFPGLGKISPESLTPILKELKMRQVPIRILASPEDKKAAERYKGLADTRFVKGMENGYVVADDNALHIFLSKNDLGTDSWSAIWSTRKDCIKRSVEHFEYAWRYGRAKSRLIIGECPNRMLQIIAGKLA